MAVTTAPLGRHSRYVAFKKGNLAGNRQEELNQCSLRTSVPGYSFDRYYNLVWTHHVKPRARSRFDGAWVIAQFFNFRAQ